MTKEEKQLLLKDLCARLPYGVKGVYTKSGIEDGFSSELTPFLYGEVESSLNGYRKEKIEFKPYLRPMSSMTEEEKTEYATIIVKEAEQAVESFTFGIDGIDWLNAHHFDYRLLIEKDLALEAPEGMYKQ